MSQWSSEAHKLGIFPPRPIEEMSEQEINEWRNSLDPDMMGFDGTEYPEDGDNND